MFLKVQEKTLNIHKNGINQNKKKFPMKTKMIFNAVNNQRKPQIKIKNIFTCQIGAIKMLITSNIVKQDSHSL